MTLFESATARRLRTTRTAFAVLIGLRIALGPYRALAGQPAELFRPVSFLRWLHVHRMPGTTAIAALQVVGVVAALAAAAAAAGKPRRAGLAVAWLSLLVLAGLRTSTGKLLHNDTLMLIGTLPLLFAPAPDPSEDGRQGRRYGWALSVGLAAVCLAYFLAGVAKLRHSGLAWVTSDNMRYVMLDAARSGRPWLPAVARFMARHALLAKGTAAGILGLELAFPLAFAAKRARPYFAAAAVALHVGTWLALGLDYWLWAATALLLLAPPAWPAIARPRPAAAPIAQPSPP
jgi:hypothetical protein